MGVNDDPLLGRIFYGLLACLALVVVVVVPSLVLFLGPLAVTVLLLMGAGRIAARDGVSAGWVWGYVGLLGVVVWVAGRLVVTRATGPEPVIALAVGNVATLCSLLLGGASVIFLASLRYGTYEG